jgi:hypothetical protein
VPLVLLWLMVDRLRSRWWLPAAVLAVYGLTLGYYDAQPGLPSPARSLASWLGKPTVIYHVDGFTVLGWRNTNLLARHPPGPARGAPGPKVINVNHGSPAACDLMCEGG